MHSSNAARDNEELVHREITEAWNGGNLDVIDELFAEEFVDHVPLVPDRITGPGGHKQMIRAFRATFPDLELHVDHLLADERSVAFKFTMRGTHDGDFVGIDPTGNEIEIMGLVFALVEDGQFTESWAVFDQLGMLRQIGLKSSPTEITNVLKGSIEFLNADR